MNKVTVHNKEKKIITLQYKLLHFQITLHYISITLHYITFLKGYDTLKLTLILLTVLYLAVATIILLGMALPIRC